MEGTEAVRLSVYWGDRLLEVSQVSDPRALTAADVFGEGISAAGVSPALRLFSDEVRDTARLQLGPLTLVAQPVTPPARLPRFSMPEDWTFFKVVVMTGLALVAVLVSIALSPEGMPQTSDDIIGDTVRIIRQAQPKPVDKKFAEAIARAKGAEGKAGEKKAPKDRSPKEDTLAKPRKNVRDVGLLALVKGGGFDRLIQSDTNSVVDQGLVGLKNGAKTLGNANGLGGMGARHDNEGGGGDEWTNIGGVGTNGRCVKNCSPHGGLDLNEGRKVSVIPPSGPTKIIGGLSKEEIARVVRRHQSEIKYCYESELQKNPSLRGKVSVWWEIDPAGGVSDAKIAESTLDNPTAEQCLLTKIRKWRFPEPEGGGIVNVTYPWVFSSAGDSGE